MKNTLLAIVVVISSLTVACDVQSGITKKSVEKYEATPTPVKVVEPEVPIDPADVVSVDTALDGPKLTVYPSDDKKEVDCSKYNRVMINADAITIKIKGICKQLMINGDRNQIETVALTEVVINGGDNAVTYSKFVNGKRQIVKDNGAGNTIEKIAGTNPK